MKICICCSLKFIDPVMDVAHKLEELGYEVELPHGIIVRAVEQPGFDPVAAKHDNGYDAMRAHFDKIRKSDAILVCNFTKNDVENYIGANTFLEMGCAYSLNKPIFTLNPLPDYKYINDEILAFESICLEGDPANITKHLAVK